MKDKRKFTLSLILAINILTMFLPWFGGARGVQEIRGVIVLFNPVTIIAVILTIIGLGKKNNKFVYLGICGILLMEIYYFLTWHIQTITGRFSIHISLSMAYPEFYLGLAITVVMLVLNIYFTRKVSIDK